MSDTDGANHMTEALSRTTREAAQLAAAVLMAMQVTISSQRRRLDAQADTERSDMRPDHRQRGGVVVEPAGDKRRWELAFEPAFATATTSEAGAVWAATQVSSDNDLPAAAAQRRAEQRLAQLHPDLMDRYDRHRQDGLSPVQAMLATCSAALTVDEDVPGRPWVGAAPAGPAVRVEDQPVEVVGAGHGHDRGAAEAARTVAQEERGEALQDLSRRDLASTPGVNERATAAVLGADHQALSDARHAQAETLVGRAYPQTIHAALAARVETASSPAKPLAPGVTHRPRRGR